MSDVEFKELTGIDLSQFDDLAEEVYYLSPTMKLTDVYRPEGNGVKHSKDCE